MLFGGIEAILVLRHEGVLGRMLAGERNTGKRGRTQRVLPISVSKALLDPHLFLPWFKNQVTWTAWFALIKAIFGEPLNFAELKIYKDITNRTRLPNKPFSEVFLVCGRRAGKSAFLALVAVFLACFKDWRPYLSPGEVGTVMVIAADRQQARVIFRYISAYLDLIPMLKAKVKVMRAESVDLDGDVVIEVHTATFRGTRGYTIIAALLDELAFWRSEESLVPDEEIINAIRPGMGTIPGALMLGASSPYARRGALWRTYNDHFGNDDSDVLVVQAPTWVMNPTFPERIYRNAYEKDPSSADAEYGAQFRRDIESFIPREILEASYFDGRVALGFAPEFRYRAFVDPSGGSKDSMCLAIAHYDPKLGKCLLDFVKEKRPPFNPGQLVSELAEDLGRFGLFDVSGDRYGGEWVRKEFEKNGIIYVPVDEGKSQIYIQFLPLIMGGKVELVDNKRLIAQFAALERKTTRGAGREVVDHPPKMHDDVSNAVAGAMLMAWKDSGGLDLSGAAFSSSSSVGDRISTNIVQDVSVFASAGKRWDF